MWTVPGRGGTGILDMKEQFPEPHFRKDNVGHYIMIKGSVLQGDIIILNV